MRAIRTEREAEDAGAGADEAEDEEAFDGAGGVGGGSMSSSVTWPLDTMGADGEQTRAQSHDGALPLVTHLGEPIQHWNSHTSTLHTK